MNSSMFEEATMQSDKVFHFLIIDGIIIDSHWWITISLGVTPSRILFSNLHLIIIYMNYTTDEHNIKVFKLSLRCLRVGHPNFCNMLVTLESLA